MMRNWLNIEFEFPMKQHDHTLNTLFHRELQLKCQMNDFIDIHDLHFVDTFIDEIFTCIQRSNIVFAVVKFA